MTYGNLNYRFTTPISKAAEEQTPVAAVPRPPNRKSLAKKRWWAEKREREKQEKIIVGYDPAGKNGDHIAYCKLRVEADGTATIVSMTVHEHKEII